MDLNITLDEESLEALMRALKVTSAEWAEVSNGQIPSERVSRIMYARLRLGLKNSQIHAVDDRIDPTCITPANNV